MRLLIIGGSDAGISAAMRARELDAEAHITVVVADAYPNFSICGLPYYLSGDVPLVLLNQLQYYPSAYPSSLVGVRVGRQLSWSSRAS
jgi:NADPH-dependent 2,4-dienoyl-CoA reductase/sulfur reductase-like enzyme